MAENVWGINHSVLKKSCATCFHFHGLATYCEVNVRARHQHSKTEIHDQRFPNVFTLKKTSIFTCSTTANDLQSELKLPSK